MGLSKIPPRLFPRTSLLKSVKTFSPTRHPPSPFGRGRQRDAKKTLNFFLISILFIFHSTGSWAGDSWKPADPDVSPFHLPSKILSDLSNVFSLESLPPLALGTIGTAFDWGAYDTQDTLARRLVQLNVQPLFDFGNFYGEGWVEGGVALGSWSFGALTRDLRLQQFGRDASESLLLATILVEGVKVAVNRTRPDGGSDSFPSGHSITAFCFAPVMQKYGGWELGIPAYTLATLTAFSRVEGYHHYLSDVIAGAALGIIVGNAVVYAPKDVSVSAGLGRIGLKLAFN